jgi:hypothetical protein
MQEKPGSWSEMGTATHDPAGSDAAITGDFGLKT